MNLGNQRKLSLWTKLVGLSGRISELGGYENISDSVKAADAFDSILLMLSGKHKVVLSDVTKTIKLMEMK